MTEKFERALEDMRNCIRIMQDFCTECTIMIREGTRAYGKVAPVVPNTRTCSICGKPRYNGEYDDK